EALEAFVGDARALTGAVGARAGGSAHKMAGIGARAGGSVHKMAGLSGERGPATPAPGQGAGRIPTPPPLPSALPPPARGSRPPAPPPAARGRGPPAPEEQEANNPPHPRGVRPTADGRGDRRRCSSHQTAAATRPLAPEHETSAEPARAGFAREGRSEPNGTG